MFKWLKEKLGMEEKENLEKEELEEVSEESQSKEETHENIENKEAEEISEDSDKEVEDDNLKDTEDDLVDNSQDNNINKETDGSEVVEEDLNPEVEEASVEVKEDDAQEISKEDEHDNEVFDEHEDDVIKEETTEDIPSSTEETIVVEEEPQEEIQEEPQKKPNFFEKLKDGLNKTRKEVGIKINTVLGNYVKIDDEMLEDLEDILISADIGMNTTMQLIDNLRETIIREKINDPTKVKPLLMEEAKKLMNPELNTGLISESPTIILIVGVNGVGKTTTIGKLSQRFKNEGKSVLVCAADTFRAAAIDQLKEWGNRSHVDVISHEEGSDPAAVVFDAIAAAKARKSDVLIIDTAGRLHNKANLMKELEKINRIINKNYPEANRETLLVLDATTGQNAMNQAKTFKEASEITGIALTKLDGTAKGGVVIALQSELEIPIKLIGVGEGIYDLQDFDIDNFIEAIFE
ncbi:signal recognition particle-docking protein FtsY [Peptoniphilus sp.]|jgi:fused signal recognition particle receptor|uniref:signal recognition particle-docking protein FtsY n=1 Tax=Peptoniphilus sp. TaxID=1971214 RepID=UPI003D933EDF